MEKLAEIIREGSEHLSRKVKLLALKRRIKRLEKQTSAHLTQIGRIANLDCPEEISRHNPELASLIKERDSIIENRDQKIKQLRRELSDQQQEHSTDAEFELGEGLEELLAARSKMRGKQARLEAEIKLRKTALNEESQEKETTPEGDAALKKELEQLEEELAGLTRKKDENQDQIDSIHKKITSYRVRQQRFIEKVSHGEKEERKILRTARKKLDPVDKKIRQLYGELGSQLVDHRPDCEALRDVFSEYDLDVTTLEAAKNSLKSEATLLEMLTRKNVMLFYSLSAATFLILIALIWLLLVLFFFH